MLHNKHLQQIVACIQQQQLVHALLLQGALITTLRTFADAVAMALVCYHPSQAPCFNCQACILSKNNQHPDVRYISTATSATKSGIITIDIVREIIDCAYLSPQLGHQRVFIIEPADRLGMAASNALLKILEEPPQGVYFLLLTSYPSQLLNTIMSRCQRWIFDLQAQEIDHTALLNDCIAVVTQQESVSTVAMRLAQHDPIVLMHQFYSLYAELIVAKMCGHEKKAVLSALSCCVLYQQLDRVSQVMHKLNNTMHVNIGLAVEDLLVHLIQQTRILC